MITFEHAPLPRVTGTSVFRDAKRPVGRYTQRPGVTYEGVRPETKVLAKGTQVEKGALPLPCDIRLDQDVAVQLRDGTTLYVDVFRPVDRDALPTVMAWCPYGKQAGISSVVPVDIPMFPMGMRWHAGGDPATACRGRQQHHQRGVWCD